MRFCLVGGPVPGGWLEGDSRISQQGIRPPQPFSDPSTQVAFIAEGVYPEPYLQFCRLYSPKYPEGIYQTPEMVRFPFQKTLCFGSLPWGSKQPNAGPTYLIVSLKVSIIHMGGYQNLVPFGSPKYECRIILKTQKWTVTLTTAHILGALRLGYPKPAGLAHAIAIPQSGLQGSHILVPRPNTRGIPEIMLCRILMFMWSFGAL